MSWKTKIESASIFFFIIAQFVSSNASAAPRDGAPAEVLTDRERIEQLLNRKTLQGSSDLRSKRELEARYGAMTVDADGWLSLKDAASLSGPDLRSKQINADTCKAKCSRENACRAFSWNPSRDGECLQYFSQIFDYVRSEGSLLAFKQDKEVSENRSSSEVSQSKGNTIEVDGVGGKAPATPGANVPPAPNPEPTTVTPPAAVTPPAKIDLGRRVALVIGNGRYDHAVELPNPRNDAEAIAGKFRALGFTDVEELHDLNLVALSAALKAFGDRASNADWAVIYYAGHGIEVGGTNYLIPTDARLLDASHVEDETITLSRLLAKVEGARKMRLVMLDACRENPFAMNMRSVKGATRSIGRGLGSIEPTGGVLVAYAARDGQLAADGEGANSPFASAILDLLDQPGLEINLFFRRVRDAVLQRTGLKQEPFTYGSLPAEEFYFRPAQSIAAPSTPVGPLTIEAAQAWETVRASDDLTVLEGFRKQFGAANPFYDSLAANRIVALSDEANKRAGAEELAKVDTEAKRKEEQHVAMRAEEDRKARERSNSLPPGAHFRDCEDKDANGNFICPEMVVIPAGEFKMGSPTNEEERGSDEEPLHTVTIEKPFAVGKAEIAFIEWDACVVSGGCSNYYEVRGNGRFPATSMSWDEAKKYTAWLSSKTQKPYRLLSEAEWEFAARAGTETAFSTGSSITTDLANFNGGYGYGGGGKGIFRGRTTEVGSFRPNPFGLHDMQGNVWEWVEDCYNENYRGASNGGTVPKGDSCDRRVLRGGSWANWAADLRSANRHWDTSTNHHFLNGFRVGRTLDP